MNFLGILLLTAAAASPRVSVTDTLHTRLSRIVKTTIADELRARSVDVTDAGDYVAEIVDVSDASRSARTSWVQRDMINAVQVTEIVGGAAAEVRLYDSNRHLVATYKLTGSGSSSVGLRKDPFSGFMAPLFSKARSAEAARAIGHDIAVSIAGAISAPASGTPQR